MSPPKSQRVFNTTLIILTSLLIHVTFSQPTTSKAAILTPLQLRNNGANLMFNIQEVSLHDTHFDTNVLNQNGWNFIIKTDETFAIDTTDDSTIEFTTNLNSFPNTQELFFAFTTDNKKYISILIPMDSFGKINKIYPSCSLTSSLQVAYGDIASQPKTNRYCDIANGCDNWQYLLPYNTGINSRTPTKLTFKFQYNIHTNDILFTYESSSFAPGFVQKCKFASDFISSSGLKMYIAGDISGNSYSISSFEIQSYVIKPIILSPPLFIPTLPTNNPTQNPIFPTFYPTPSPIFVNFPTDKPTNNPTIKPTNNPLKSPSYNPTKYPTNNPTENTISPSESPSNYPSTTPTKKPTNIPTLYPTNAPTYNPTFSPTIRPTPFGKQWGAYNQLCNIPPLPNQIYKCQSSNDILIDTFGRINCQESYDCCQCHTIECGLNGEQPCEELSVLGEYGLFGVKQIYLVGSPSDLVNPVSIDCQGAHSCQETMISATNVGVMECDGSNACHMAEITIHDPRNDFLLDCAGISSCEGLHINIILSAMRGINSCNINEVKNIFSITKIACNSERACESLEISIENNGCDKVIIQDLECIQPNSCNHAKFNLIGDIAIENCHCGSNGCDTTIGIDSCFMKNLNLYHYLCNDPRQCYEDKNIIIENPRNGFELVCASIQSCTYAQFVIKFNDNPSKLENVEFLNGIKISGDYSAQYAIFRFENTQIIGKEITVNKIECNGYKACEMTTFITGVGVKINEISCIAESCGNCYIKQTVTSPGIPCDPTQTSSIIPI